MKGKAKGKCNIIKPGWVIRVLLQDLFKLGTLLDGRWDQKNEVAQSA